MFSNDKKTGPSTILKTVRSNCPHLFDILTKFGQNHVHQAVFKRPHVLCTSMFTYISMY